MIRYPVSICANLVTWPSITIGIALGAFWGALLAVVLALVVLRMTVT